MIAAMGLKDVRFLAIISEKQAPKLLAHIKEDKLKLQGEVGKCSHPQSGYIYRTIKFVKETKFEEASNLSGPAL
jgi:hypothetical protein